MKSIEKRSNDFFYILKKYFTLVSISNQYRRKRKINQTYCTYNESKTDFSIQVSCCGYLEDCLCQGRGRINYNITHIYKNIKKLI